MLTGTFVQQLDQAMEDADARRYKSTDLPICSVCDTVSLDCAPLPSCAHPACPKCLAIASLSTACSTSTCRTCVEQESNQLAFGSVETMQKTASPGSCKDGDLVQSSLKEEFQAASVLPKEETGAVQKSHQEEIAVLSPSEDAETPPRDRAIPQTVLQAEEATQSLNKEEEGVQVHVEEAQEAVESAKDVTAALGQIDMPFVERKSRSLSESVAKIQEALSVATKYSHCASCLQAKKSQAPDLLCLDCALSFCIR